MARRILLAAGLVAVAAAFPLAATGSQRHVAAPQTVAVGMYGTIVSPAQLAFTPARITVAVGDTVRWTNHSIVPHTATEDHHLWDLAGSYAATPINPAGVAPNASVQRVFEAGTFQYYCRVHPKQMHGTISVPVTLSVTSAVTGRRRHRHRVYTIHALWDTGSPPAGEVFDVQRARGGGAFTPWLTGTSSGAGAFSAGRRGTTWHVEARLRRASDATIASGWSPDALVIAV